MSKQTLRTRLDRLEKDRVELTRIARELKPLNEQRKRLEQGRQKKLDSLYSEYIGLVEKEKIPCTHPEYWGENDTGRTWCNICQERGTGDEDWGEGKINYHKIILALKRYYNVE